MKRFHIGFYENRKIFFAISIGITLIGLILNFVFGTKLAAMFTGGAVVNYSYTGEINQEQIDKIAQNATGKQVTVSLNKNMKASSDSSSANTVTISFAGTGSLTLAQQQAVANGITDKYPNSNLKVLDSSSVDASMGRDFFIKCIVSVLMAFFILIVYIAFRFKKIGGMSAGFMAIVSLLHDVAMVYFTFIIFQIPLNDNFIAVVLTILGYSLNDTIIVYDRIRENRKLMGPKVDASVVVNTSINQTFTRSIFTAGCTFASITTVFVVGLIFNLSSVTTFALPMMIGIITGCYSSICIAGPLYVMWQKHKAKMNATEIPAKVE